MFEGIQAFMQGSGASAAARAERERLAPSPVPEDLYELRNIVAAIANAVERSPYVSADIKRKLNACTCQLEAECSQLGTLKRLAQRAANESANVLLSRIRFFEALDDRIRGLSQIRERFLDSRRYFREKPAKLLAWNIRDARGHAHEGMYSDLKPLFDQIDAYYGEVNVSLRAEEHRLKTIRSSLRVTPDDKLRWEDIRNACREASRLLASQSSPSPPHTSQPANNTAAHNIQELARIVTVAHHRLQQTYRNITPLTQHSQFDLLRLKDAYESGEQTCRKRIGEVLEFSEDIVPSFVEVRPPDDFRDHLLPAAAASSSQTLNNVAEDIRNIMRTIQEAPPHTAEHFARFEHCLPIADASMQRTYHKLRGLVQPLDQPNDPNRGVLRHMTRVQLREEQHAWRGLGEQWERQL